MSALLLVAVLAGRGIARQRSPVCAAAVGGCIILFLCICLTIVMHTLNIPITTSTLLTAFIFSGITIALIHTTTCRRIPWKITPDIPLILLPGLVVFIILILPYTHFTGIDTYKWQDLATAIKVEHNIPWLIHPLSLLGFTPRSYPSAQPILLAYIQIIGNFGVEAGFTVLSIFTASLGCAAAYFLGLRIFPTPRTAAIFALLYIFSPVFTRYTHWATGRGLFLAIYPLLLAIPIRSTLGRHSHRLSFILYPLSFLSLSLLLSLSHKVGFIMSLAAIPLYLFGLLMPKHSRRSVIIISILPFTALALVIVQHTMLPPPFGSAIGLIRYSITRFGLLMPLAIIGLTAPKDLFSSIAWRRLYPLMLLSIPLAFERHMYGALIALPMITIAATQAIEMITMPTQRAQTGLTHSQSRRACPASKMAQCLSFIFYLLSFALSLSVIIHRSRIATPPAVYRTAMFLEQHDPLGPFTITAPGRSRTQIQAYVSGCPRFNVNSTTNSTIKLTPLPPLKGNPLKTLENWTSYMRGFMTIPETSTDWYGTNPRHYYITIDGQGKYPPESTQIYNKDGIRIFIPKPL